jgi:hypothetical protein
LSIIFVILQLYLDTLLHMDFSQWLHNQLEERGWTSSDLVASAKARGYSLDTAITSRILNRETQGGINTVIAIAHGLHLPRHIVFIARGWLFSDPDLENLATTDPDLLTFLREASDLPAHIRQPLLSSVNTMVQTIKIAQDSSSVSDPGDEHEWVTVEEAARKTGYSIRTVQKLLQEEKVLGRKEGYRGTQWVTTVESILEYKETARRGRPNR